MKFPVVFFALASVASAGVSLKFFGIPSESSNSIEWASNDVVKPTICFNEQKHAKDDVKRWKLAIVGPWMRARKLKDVVFKPVDVTATNDREVQDFVNSVNINVDGKPLCYSAAFTVPADLPKRKAFQLKFKRSVPFLPFLYHSRNKSDKFPILKEHTSSYYQTASTDAVDNSAALSAADDYVPEVEGQDATGSGDDVTYDSGMRDIDSTQEPSDRFLRNRDSIESRLNDYERPGARDYAKFVYDRSKAAVDSPYYQPAIDSNFNKVRAELDAKHPEFLKNALFGSESEGADVDADDFDTEDPTGDIAEPPAAFVKGEDLSGDIGEPATPAELVEDEDSTGDIREPDTSAEFVEGESDYPASEVLDENANLSDDFNFKKIRYDLDAKYPALYENAATRFKNAARNQQKREQRKRAAERKKAAEEEAYAQMADLGNF